MVRATGIGSWPGHDVREALRIVRGELADRAVDGVATMPYLPELPARGPSAEMVGRAAGLLVDLPVDLQPQGWRLVDRPGRDAERTASWWRQDLDELAEIFDGWDGPLKVQVTGPWTLAAALWLPLGDRVLSDAGAVRDLAGSLAEGVAEHVRAVRGLVPGATLTVQLDEPGLPTVLAGHVRTDSGLGVLPVPEPSQAEAVLGAVLQAARDAGAGQTVVHCCGDRPPLPVLGGSGPDAVAIDTSTLGTRGWESVAATLEAGVEVWAGVLPATGTPDVQQAADTLVERWREVGLEPARLAALTVTPVCGLAGAAPELATAITRASVDLAQALAEHA